MFQSVWDSLSAGRQRFGQPASERSSALDTGSIALGLQGDVSLPVLAAHASPPIRGWSATTDLLTGPLSAAGPAADAGRLGERPGHLGHHGRTPGAPTYVQDRPANAARAIARTWGAAPRLVIPVGTLAIGLLLPDAGKLVDVVGRQLRVTFAGVEFDAVPLPHPSGASPWHRTEPGVTLVRRAMERVAAHPAFLAATR